MRGIPHLVERPARASRRFDRFKAGAGRPAWIGATLAAKVSVPDQPRLFEAVGEPERADGLFPVPGRSGGDGKRRGKGRRPAGDATEDLEALAARLESTGRYRVLRRFETRLDGPPRPDEAAGLRKGVYLDVETTGTAPHDRITELALLVFHYDDSGRVARVSQAFDALEDPGRRIPAEVVALTGITDDMVRGKRIDDGEVEAIVRGAEIVVAHNAGFDRYYVESRFPFFRDLPWACSVNDVDWAAAGFRSRRLEQLALARGYFYQAHRAIHDCHVALGLLGDPLFDGGPTALSDLLARSSRETVRLWAERSPFEKKDELKARYYRWNGQAKVWWRDLPADDHEAELEWLASAVYTRRPPLPYLRFDARLRYSPRVPEAPPPGAERL